MPGRVFLFLGRAFGGSKSPLRCLFVVFRQWLWERFLLLNIDNHRRSTVIIFDCYYMCKKTGESVDHLLLNCDYASELWSLVSCLFGCAVGYAVLTYRCVSVLEGAFKQTG